VSYIAFIFIPSIHDFVAFVAACHSSCMSVHVLNSFCASKSAHECSFVCMLCYFSIEMHKKTENEHYCARFLSDFLLIWPKCLYFAPGKENDKRFN
jgi:hypothetical protein